MILMLKDKLAAKMALKLLNTFGKGSGLKINVQKSEGMWMGNECSGKPFRFNWPLELIRVLEIYLSYDKNNCMLLSIV